MVVGGEMCGAGGYDRSSTDRVQKKILSEEAQSRS